MAEHKRMYNSQIEINDLIDDAVKNAVARRDEALLSMSDQEAQSVSGGTSLPITDCKIILGKIIKPPTTAIMTSCT